jgi:hypothetical protein
MSNHASFIRSSFKCTYETAFPEIVVDSIIAVRILFIANVITIF